MELIFYLLFSTAEWRLRWPTTSVIAWKQSWYILGYAECYVSARKGASKLRILHEAFQDSRWICHDKEQCHLGIRIKEHETGLDLGDFMNLLCRSSALLLIGTHLLSLILLELSRKPSWQLTTRRIILMNVDYATVLITTVLITQEWWLAAWSKWSDR